MKLIKYVLNEDGTIPEYIIDGGYYPAQNSNQSPQDLTLIGVVDDVVPSASFSGPEEIKNYLISIGGEEWKDVDNNPIDLEFCSTQLWQKVI